METISQSIGLDVGVMFLLLLVLIIILAVITVIMSMRVSRLTKKYQTFMRGKDGETMEAVFLDKFDEIERIAEQNDAMAQDVKLIKSRFFSTFSHYGIVKYDAFDDVGGKMSFALAMLDDNDTGIVLNTVHSRDNCFLYLKEIVKGESYIMLSTEEVEALKNATAYKDE